MKHAFLPIITLVVVLFPLASFAQDAARDRCLFAAASRLPKVSGLDVISSEVASLGEHTFKINYLIKLAGQTFKKAYVCTSTSLSIPLVLVDAS